MIARRWEVRFRDAAGRVNSRKRFFFESRARAHARELAEPLWVPIRTYDVTLADLREGREVTLYEHTPPEQAVRILREGKRT